LLFGFLEIYADFTELKKKDPGRKRSKKYNKGKMKEQKKKKKKKKSAILCASTLITDRD